MECAVCILLLFCYFATHINWQFICLLTSLEFLHDHFQQSHMENMVFNNRMRFFLLFVVCFVCLTRKKNYIDFL